MNQTEVNVYFPDVGYAVRKKREELGYVGSKLSILYEQLSERLTIRPSTVGGRIKQIDKGYVYGSGSVIGAQENGDKHLRILSAYLAFLDFDPQDPIIQKIMNADNRFVYPPQ